MMRSFPGDLPERKQGLPEHSRNLNEVDEPSFQATREKVEQTVGLERLAKSLVEMLAYCVSRTDLKPLSISLFLLLSLSLQGCHFMHRPAFDEKNGFQDHPDRVGLAEGERRKNEIIALLQDPTKDKNKALVSGIGEDQRKRILAHYSDLFERVSTPDFEEFLGVCRFAREQLGILNFDRYDPSVLRTVVRNFQDVEYNSNKPLVLVFVARQDSSAIGDLQPLNVESYQIAKLLDGYKVLLFECSSFSEVTYDLEVMIDRGLLGPGKIHGLVNGAHGSSHSTSTGLNIDTIPFLADRFSEYFSREPILVFSSCYSGEGRENGVNLVNVAQAVFRKQARLPQVLGCDGLLVKVELDLDEEHRVEIDEVVLGTFANLVSFDLIDDTYFSQDFQPEAFLKALRSACKAETPDHLIQSCVQQGIFDPFTINLLHTKKIAPERLRASSDVLFEQGISLNAFSILEYLEHGIPLELVAVCRKVFRFIALDELLTLQNKHFSLADLDRLQVFDQHLQPHQFIKLLDQGLRIDDLVRYCELGFRDFYDLERLSQLISATQLSMLKDAGFDLLDYFHAPRFMLDRTSPDVFIKYAQQGLSKVDDVDRLSRFKVSPEDFVSLKNAGFEPSAILSEYYFFSTLSIEQCLAYARVGILDFHKIGTLSCYRIPPETAAIWIASGKGLDGMLKDHLKKR